MRKNQHRVTWASILAMLATTVPAWAGDGTWNVDASGDWGTDSNWLGGNPGDIADGATSTANFTNDISTTRTVTLDSSRSIGNLNFSDNGFSSNPWVLNSPGAFTLTLGDGVTPATSTITTTTPTTITAILGGINNVVYDGAAGRTVSGTNTYTGTTLIRNGVLSLNGGASNNTDGLLGNSATAVELGDASTSGNIGLRLATGTPMARDIHVSNANVSGGSVTLIGFNGGTGYFNGNVSIDSGRSVNLESDATSVWSGVFSGGGNVVFTGSSAHSFGNASSSYTGTTTISSGVVTMLGDAPAAGNGIFGNASGGAIQVGDAGSGATSIVITGANTVGRDIDVNAAATGSIQIGSAGGAGSYTGTMTLNRNVDFISSGTLYLTGKITGAGGIRFITNATDYYVGGAATNDYAGGTTISQGVVRVLTAGGLSSSTIEMTDASTLGGTANLLANAAGLTIGQNIHVANSVGNSTGVVNIGTGTLGAGSIFSGNMVLDRDVNLISPNGGQDVTFNGVISGVGGIRRNGNSNVTAIINGNNTYTGDSVFDYGFTLVGGNVAPSTNGPLGNSANAIQFSNAASGGVGLFTNGNYTISRNITAAAGGSGRQIYLGTYSASGTSNFNGTVSLADTLILQSSGGTVNFNNTVSGSLVASLSMNSGEINLNAANTFTLTSGNYVSLNGGILGVGNDNALNGNTVRFFNGGMQAIGGNRTINSDVTVGRPVYTIGSYNVTFTGLVDTNGINDGGGVNWSINNPVTAFTGQVSGNYGINKGGNGKLILSGDNIYTGNTTVAAGTLAVNNTTGSGTGTGTVTVNSGATLGGSGIIDGAVTVNGAIAPGNSAGTLTVNNSVTFNGGSSYVVEVSAASTDRLDVNVGTITLGNATLTVSAIGPAYAPDLIFIVINDTGNAISGTFNLLAEGATVNFVGGAYPSGTAQISYQGDFGTNSLGGGNDVVLYNFQNVPEPASLAMLGLGALWFWDGAVAV